MALQYKLKYTTRFVVQLDNRMKHNNAMLEIAVDSVDSFFESCQYSSNEIKRKRWYNNCPTCEN